jgi:hypothetical protein
LQPNFSTILVADSLCDQFPQKLDERILAVCNTETFQFRAESRGACAFTVTVRYSRGLVLDKQDCPLELPRDHTIPKRCGIADGRSCSAGATVRKRDNLELR